MFFKTTTLKYTNDYWEQIRKLKNEIIHADAVLMGAGAGFYQLSCGAADTVAQDFAIERSLIMRESMDCRMYVMPAGFYPYDTLEEYWAYWSRHVYLNRYQFEVRKPY
ncbi:MAG: hypothetical protein ACLS28_00450 [Clostridium neonatale]